MSYKFSFAAGAKPVPGWELGQLLPAIGMVLTMDRICCPDSSMALSHPKFVWGSLDSQPESFPRMKIKQKKPTAESEREDSHT